MKGAGYAHKLHREYRVADLPVVEFNPGGAKNPRCRRLSGTLTGQEEYNWSDTKLQSR